MRNAVTVTMLFLLSTLLVSCGDHLPTSAMNQESYLQGQTSFQDAKSNFDGTPREPAFPTTQEQETPMKVELIVRGQANLSNQLNTDCELDGDVKKFRVAFYGDADINETGFYFSTLPVKSGKFLTQVGGCVATSAEQIRIDDALVMGKIVTDDMNCTDYCGAKARVYSVGKCGESDPVCRFMTEIKYVNQCISQCTNKGSYLGAQTLLNAAELKKLTDLENIQYRGVGTLNADLIFTHIFAPNGAIVPDYIPEPTNDCDDGDCDNEDDEDDEEIDDYSCGKNKVYVCHTKPKKNPHTICISKHAVKAHLKHGDYLGQCKD